MRKGILFLLALAAISIGTFNIWADRGGCRATQQDLAIESVFFDESDFPWRADRPSAVARTSWDEPPPIDCLCSEGCCINNLCWVEAGPYPFPQVFLFQCGGPGF